MTMQNRKIFKTRHFNILNCHYQFSKTAHQTDF